MKIGFQVSRHLLVKQVQAQYALILKPNASHYFAKLLTLLIYALLVL